MRKSVYQVSDEVQHKLGSTAQKIVKTLKFWTLKVKELYYLCSENIGAIQLCSLICAFVIAYAKSRFCHNVAHSIDA